MAQQVAYSIERQKASQLFFICSTKETNNIISNKGQEALR